MTMRGVLALTGLLVAVLVVIAALTFLLSPRGGNNTADSTTIPVTPTQPPAATTTSTSRFVLQDGQVVYRAPSPMQVNEVQRVTVRVAGSDAPPELTSGLPGTGSITVDPAKVGTDLAADLSGPEFQITRVGSGDDGKRELQEGGFAEWAWDVRPAKSGKLKLDFVLYVAKETGGAPVYYRTYAHEVEVEVNFSYSFGKFVKDYGALTGLSVPVVVGALWTFFRWLRKKRKSKPDLEPVEE
ncbi:hypothetical protein [Lentzea sp. NPDC051838]|uniref:hypothetical protein n=1 Tax=Lentzea sp. NPDC051838 TaxID=3154849 RepID=UPI003439C124